MKFIFSRFNSIHFYIFQHNTAFYCLKIYFILFISRKYILCHVPLTAGLSHRGLVSGSFRTLTGSFATLGAVWLPD